MKIGKLVCHISSCRYVGDMLTDFVSMGQHANRCKKCWNRYLEQEARLK